VLRGGSILFTGKLFTYGARILMTILLARILGADQYGLYSLAMTTAALIATFAALGMDSAVVRYVSRSAAHDDPAGIRGTLQVGLGLPALAATVGGLVTFAFANEIASRLLGQPSVADLLRVTAVLVPLTVMSRQLAAALQGFKRIELAVLAEQFAQPVFRMAVLVVLALVGLTAWNATVAATAAAGMATLLLGVFVIGRVRRVAHVRPRRSARELVTFSIPVYFSNLVTTFGGTIQTFLLSILGTLTEIGIFAVANHVNLISTLFHSSIVASSMASFAELDARGDRSALGSLYRLTSRWTFTLNLPFFLFAVLFPTQLMGLFGAEFVDGASALIVLAFAGLVNSSTGTSGALLDMSGHTKVKLINATIGVAASVVLSVALIPAFGVLGAAVAALGATASVNVLRLVQLRVLTGLSPYDRSFLVPIGAAMAAGAAALAMLALAGSMPGPIQVLLGGGALLAVYAAVLMRFGMSQQDRAFLTRVRERLRRRTREAPASDTGDDDPSG
jgi:O-antigen/teichoic acid export membrane protein